MYLCLFLPRRTARAWCVAVACQISGWLALSGMATPATAAEPAATVRAPLDVLFYSPSERRAMVRERSGSPEQEDSSLARVSGIVKRERGNSTAWINQQPVAEGHSLAPTTRTTISNTHVTLDGQRVRVGETLDLRTRERTDMVAPGAVTAQGKK